MPSSATEAPLRIAWGRDRVRVASPHLCALLLKEAEGAKEREEQALQALRDAQPERPGLDPRNLDELPKEPAYTFPRLATRPAVASLLDDLVGVRLPAWLNFRGEQRLVALCAHLRRAHYWDMLEFSFVGHRAYETNAIGDCFYRPLGSGHLDDVERRTVDGVWCSTGVEGERPKLKRHEWAPDRETYELRDDGLFRADGTFVREVAPW